ncbi:hypothetical protein CDEST_11960 [Colletotrichum destructivum]|uniref:Bacteriophage T5 Orf172 DNA-binding domain-containing protein n=1 Tax=Colletotrichum destructivum TaxID=34406 RepID=A0AAX4IUZ0_9PEZI|nr:hypothetical protein CDEST_11960 [Colletotrichum destructivum]
MASSTTSEYPVLKEVIAIVEAFDKQPNPENWDYERCPADKTTSVGRCSMPIKSANQKRANELLVHFKLLKECPATEEFVSQLKDFLLVSHCHIHERRVTSSFERWRHLHATSSISMTAQSPSKIENNSDDSSLSVDATSMSQATSSTISDPASSESTSPVEDKNFVQVEVVTDGISTLAIASAGINPSDAHDGKREQVLDTGLATEGISTLAIASASIIPDDANDERPQQMTGLGLVTPRRKKSIQDDCRVLNEIYKDLTAKQKELGVVYVLNHVKHDGLYKIGWTEKTVKERLKQSGNCCKFNTTTVYESPGERFLGAAKVEKLVHEMLRFHNVKVSECAYCAKGHREWFKAPKEMILNHIKVMECFVKLPAYTSENGERWKLSGPAYDIVRRITNITPAMIQMAMAGIEDLVQTKSETVTEVTKISVSPDPQDLEDTEGQRPSDEVDFDDREEIVGEPKESAGAKAGRFVERAMQGVEEAKDKVHRLRASRKSGEVRNIEEVVDDIFHIMYPQETQTG